MILYHSHFIKTYATGITQYMYLIVASTWDDFSIVNMSESNIIGISVAIVIANLLCGDLVTYCVKDLGQHWLSNVWWLSLPSD